MTSSYLLYLEDDERKAKAMLRALKLAGCDLEVRHFPTMMPGLRLMREELPVGVITDWNMPWREDDLAPRKAAGEHVSFECNRAGVPCIVASAENRPEGYEGPCLTVGDWTRGLREWLEREVYPRT